MPVIPVPRSETDFRSRLKIHFPFYWINEDKLDTGRPDLLYRVSAPRDTGVIELKNHRVVHPTHEFVSGATNAQAMKLRQWGEFNVGHAWLAMCIAGQVMVFYHKSPAVREWNKARSLAEWRKLALYLGDTRPTSLAHLVQWITEVHRGRHV